MNVEDNAYVMNNSIINGNTNYIRITKKNYYSIPTENKVL